MKRGGCGFRPSAAPLCARIVSPRVSRFERVRPSNRFPRIQLLRDTSDYGARVCHDDLQFVPVGIDGEESLRCNTKGSDLDRVSSGAIGIHRIGSCFGRLGAAAVTAHDERARKAAVSVESNRPNVSERAGLVGRGCNYARAALRVSTPQCVIRASFVVGLRCGRHAQTRARSDCGHGESLCDGAAFHEESPLRLDRSGLPVPIRLTATNKESGAEGYSVRGKSIKWLLRLWSNAKLPSVRSGIGFR